MSSQDYDGITLNFNDEQQNFRLLELPPTLLNLITSRNPPTLFLKSSAVQNPSASSVPSAVLCTQDETFQIRQVHSSNSLYILQPTKIPSIENEVIVPSSAISAIAQCTATLELLPSSPDAALFLRQVLPVYQEGSVHLGSTRKGYNVTSSKLETKSKFAILAEAPLSAGELEKAWIELCVFELDGQAFLPSARSLFNLWKSLVAAAAVKDVRLEESFRVTELAELVQEDGYPYFLLEAVMRRLDNGFISTTQDITIAQEQCAYWVGNALLEVLSQGSAVVIEDFLQQWQSQLPEGWKSFATLSTIDGNYRRLEDDTIICSRNVLLDERRDQQAITTLSAKGPRKWHEKFKNARQ